MKEFDLIDRKLLNILQMDFPLVPEPFAAIAAELNDGSISITLEEVLERTRQLKDEGVIRQISAIFDSWRLGYQSTLAAFQVEEGRLDRVAAAINEESGVSHNYARNHVYNLWFTLTVPRQVDIEAAVVTLAQKCGVDRYLILPAERRFKIGVRFDVQGVGERKQGGRGGVIGIDPFAIEVAELSAFDRKVIQELQRDIEITSRPFAKMAQRLSLSEEALLDKARGYKDKGVMRRYGAVLDHRKAGFRANGMGCWVVPPQQVERVGHVMASFPQVSHCYQRPTYPDWPYNLFTMIHGHNRAEVEAIARHMSQETGIGDYTLLYSTKEYKKKRVEYFVTPSTLAVETEGRTGEKAR